MHTPEPPKMGPLPEIAKIIASAKNSSASSSAKQNEKAIELKRGYLQSYFSLDSQIDVGRLTHHISPPNANSSFELQKGAEVKTLMAHHTPTNERPLQPPKRNDENMEPSKPVFQFGNF